MEWGYRTASIRLIEPIVTDNDDTITGELLCFPANQLDSIGHIREPRSDRFAQLDLLLTIIGGSCQAMHDCDRLLERKTAETREGEEEEQRFLTVDDVNLANVSRLRNESSVRV